MARALSWLYVVGYKQVIKSSKNRFNGTRSCDCPSTNATTLKVMHKNPLKWIITKLDKWKAYVYSWAPCTLIWLLRLGLRPVIASWIPIECNTPLPYNCMSCYPLVNQLINRLRRRQNGRGFQDYTISFSIEIHCHWRHCVSFGYQTANIIS